MKEISDITSNTSAPSPVIGPHCPPRPVTKVAMCTAGSRKQWTFGPECSHFVKIRVRKTRYFLMFTHPASKPVVLKVRVWPRCGVTEQSFYFTGFVEMTVVQGKDQWSLTQSKYNRGRCSNNIQMVHSRTQSTSCEVTIDAVVSRG